MFENDCGAVAGRPSVHYAAPPTRNDNGRDIDMKICILGGTGNISTSIVRRLLEFGHEVICYNRGESGDAADGARVIHGDRRADRAAFEQAMQAERFDAAIDMICFDAEDAHSSLRAFAGVGQFVMCSTVCTYGVAYDWLPATEDHPLRPISDYGRNKVAADRVLLAAHHRDAFPVTIIKPSTTFGPKWSLLRQVGGGSWIDRIRKGKPILVCGDGMAIHQFLDVDDAALCFVGVLGKSQCLGQIYNMVRRGFTTWHDYHRTAMQVLEREVEMVGVPLAELAALDTPGLGICRDIFAYDLYYSAEKLFRDVPEFQPVVSLAESMARVIEAMDRDGRVDDSDAEPWEDRVIEAQRCVRDVTWT